MKTYLKLGIALVATLVIPFVTAGIVHADIPTDAQNAANKGDIAWISKMLSSGQLSVNQPINPVSKGNTMILAATYWGQINEVEFLIDKGADVNYVYPAHPDQNEGFTPLINAVTYKQWNIVPILIEHGANTNAVDAHGRSVLTHAIASNAPAWVLALISPGYHGAPLPAPEHGIDDTWDGGTTAIAGNVIVTNTKTGQSDNETIPANSGVNNGFSVAFAAFGACTKVGIRAKVIPVGASGKCTLRMYTKNVSVQSFNVGNMTTSQF